MEIIRLIARLIDVEVDSEGLLYVILSVENKDYMRAVVRLLRQYKNKNVKIRFFEVSNVHNKNSRTSC